MEYSRGVVVAYLLVLCRAVLVGVFLVALAGKVRGHREFTASVVALRLLPRGPSVLASYLVTAAEATAVALLLLPGTTIAGFGLATALLAVFTTGIVLAVRRGTTVPCRCFGAATTPLGRVHAIRNSALVVVSIAGGTAGLVAPRSLEPAETVLVLLVSAVGVLVVVRLDDLVSLLAPPRP